MAYEIIGSVFRIGTTENIATKSGNNLQRRSITLIQRRFDQNTGEEFEPNYPMFDFTNRACADLDRFRVGDKVRIRFDISGVKYIDQQTGEERFFTSLRGFRIEPYITAKQQSTAAPNTRQLQREPPTAEPPIYQPPQQHVSPYEEPPF